MTESESQIYVYNLGERGSGTRIRGPLQDYDEIHQKCLSKRILFEDPEFPANTSSLGQWGQCPWQRPQEITGNPNFILGGTSRFDIMQGELGDCWLISAIANITLDKNVVDVIVPKNQSYKDGEYAGVFHFRFWQLGKWVDVVVDDRLPIKYNHPMFLHSSDNCEFWGSLLEKAYAKLNGSYQALVAGFTYEALEDFTGGLTEVLRLDKHDCSKLFRLMKKAYERSSLMGCSIEGSGGMMEQRTPLGLVMTHAYSVTGVTEITLGNGQKVQLVRLRNPWGNEAEWKGPWSDGSSEWKSITEEERERIGLTFDKDGEFWMSVQDFKSNFSSLDMTHLGPEALKTTADDGRRRWEVSEFHGRWVRGASAGGCNVAMGTYAQNPQYLITIEDPDPEDGDDSTKSTVIVSLMQRSRRSQGQGATNLCIGFSVYKVENPEKQSKPLQHQFFLYNHAVISPTFAYQRAVTHRCELAPGTYCIVPTTYQPYEEGEYLLRVYSEKYNEMMEHDEEFEEVVDSSKDEVEGDTKKADEDSDEETDNKIEEKIKSAFKEVSGDDGEVDWREVKTMLDEVFSEEMQGKGISKDVCRSMVALMDGNKSGKLDYDEFKKLLLNIQKWASIFEEHDEDKSGNLDVLELKDALHAAGFRLPKRILYMLVNRFAGRSGKIDLDDFLMCAIRLKGLLAVFVEKDKGKTNTATFTCEEWMEATMYS